jgi:hypothetical protein
MQLEQRSATILAFPHERGADAASSAVRISFDAERLANLAFTAIVFGLAALWLVLPPAQLSTSAPETSLARDLRGGISPR